MRGQAVEFSQPAKRGFGKGAGAAAQLEEHGLLANFPQRRRQRVGNALGKHRAQFRRGDEVAFGTELAGAGAVIAQPRRIQGQLHEP